METGASLSFYSNKEADALLKQAAATVGDERGKLFQKVWDMVYDDYYTIPIAYPAQIAGISDRIEWRPRIDSLFLLNEVAWTK